MEPESTLGCLPGPRTPTGDLAPISLLPSIGEAALCPPPTLDFARLGLWAAREASALLTSLAQPLSSIPLSGAGLSALSMPTRHPLGPCFLGVTTLSASLLLSRNSSAPSCWPRLLPWVRSIQQCVLMGSCCGFMHRYGSSPDPVVPPGVPVGWTPHHRPVLVLSLDVAALVVSAHWVSTSPTLDWQNSFCSLLPPPLGGATP